MKPYKKDFINNRALRSFVIGAISLVCVPGVAFSATDNGCGVSSNSYINPEIALCSTHVYNIRQTKNPSDATSKQAMRDVIALKTTLMTQQLEQQYDFLEATVSRLKTQLQKAVLTTNLEAAGASSGSSSGGSGGINTKGVAGAENCRSGTTIDVMNCLSRNLDRITQAINSSDLGAAQRQLETDYTTLKMYNTLASASNNNSSSTNKSSPDVMAEVEKNCGSNVLKSNQKTLNNCVDYMRVAITRNLENLQRQNTSYGYNQMRY